MAGVLALASAASSARLPSLAADVEVRSLSFRFVGPHDLEEDDLRPQIATTAPGTLERAQRLVAWLPFVPDPGRHPFAPLTLQQDMVRLRHYYRRQGCLETAVDYDVRVDSNRRWATIVITVREGRPLRLRSIALVDSTGRELDLERFVPGGGARWDKFRSLHTGRRFREDELSALGEGLLRAFQDRGYAFASVEPRAVLDSTAYAVDLACRVDAGRRMFISGFEVEGASSVSEEIVTRQLGLHVGDEVTRSGLSKGRANLQSVALFRRADVSVGAPTAGDTALPVKVALSEGKPRFTNVELGYVTDGAGITGQTRWTHPNFTGGARSLDAIALVQTGWGTTSDVPDKLARASLTLTQPYVGSPVMTLGVGPAIEYRDNRLDRSMAWSAVATLVYRFNPLRSAALRYDYTYRELDELRAYELAARAAASVTRYTLASTTIIDSLKVPTRTSEFVLFTTLGGVDDLSRPRYGLVVKPKLAVTAPRALGTVEFARADVQATLFAPLPRRPNALMLRGIVGGLWPFGHSIPEPGVNPALEWFRLRDQVFTAGGANDVRGYESGLLGPKVPAVAASESGGDTILTADRYLPIGGLRRAAATAELRLGIPWLGSDVFGHLFADAGRVWTTDRRFQLSGSAPDQERTFYTTGGGLGYYTPVGAIRLDLGYKLNPSVYDVRDPGDVVAAVKAGHPPSSAPVKKSMRYHLHLSLGLFF